MSHIEHDTPPVNASTSQGNYGGDPEKEHIMPNESEISRVGVRAPPFYPDNPALWFVQLESQFVLANITTDATKFHYALAQLDSATASIVEDVIVQTSAADKYQKLKTELVKRLSISREKKIQQLLTNEELGDRKPTQFLRHLKALAGSSVPEEFMRTIWTSRLPTSTQSIIASQSNLPLDEVAELADRIHEVVPSRPQVAATSTSAAPNSLTQEVAALSRQMQTLMLKMDRMSRDRGRSKTPRRQSGRGRSSSARRSNSSYRKFPTCWYHHKFGEKATRCVQPCDFAGNGRGTQ